MCGAGFTNDFDLNVLFCCWTKRGLGVKAIGFVYFVAHFLSLIWPVYELNHFRNNETIYSNSSLFEHVPIFANGGYEQILVAAIIFCLVGLGCNALLVWATMQVLSNSIVDTIQIQISL